VVMYEVVGSIGIGLLLYFGVLWVAEHVRLKGLEAKEEISPKKEEK
jgi:hypothetical protein